MLDALDDAGVQAWLAGGWGVDALLGEQTRPHLDLDLVFDADDDGERRALEALAELGFRVMGREPVRTHWWSERIALSDDGGHVVDLHPVSGESFIATVRGRTASQPGASPARPVRCLSRSIQIRLHEGYDARPTPIAPTWRCFAEGASGGDEAIAGERASDGSSDVRDLPQSALIVPVPSAEPAVAKWRARHDPSAALGMPAHVTVLYPFLAPQAITPAVERDLESVLSPFSTLSTSGSPGWIAFHGVLYLEPEPAEPFRELTSALHERWPDHPPYGGAFETVVPHVTVVQGPEPPEVERELEQAAPIEAEAREVWLMAERHTAGRCSDGSRSHARGLELAVETCPRATSRSCVPASTRGTGETSRPSGRFSTRMPSWCRCAPSSKGTVYRGADGLKSLLKDMSEDWEDFHIEPDELREIDESRVLILGRMQGRGKASGMEIEAPAAWVCELRDGKVTKVQFYAHEDAARDDLLGV